MSRQPTNTSSPSGAGGIAGAAGLMMGGLAMDGVPTGLTPAGLGFTPFMPGMGSSPRPGTALNGATAGATIPQPAIMAQDQEVARTAKIATMITMLSRRVGWVSQSGLERAAKRVKLEYMWEDDLPTAVGAVDQSKERTLSIAGNGVLVEVCFTGDVVQGVSLSYPEHGPGVGDFAARGAAVLKRGLQGTGQEGGFVGIESFVRDLEVLARMDKLSGGGVSAFDAVDGIRTALERIWAIEIQETRKKTGGRATDEEDLEREVLCRQSGRPRMHAGTRVGLSIEYWMARHKVTPIRQEQSPDHMDVDKNENQEATAQNEEPQSLMIECEGQSPDVYPPIRVSTNWISSVISSSADQLSQTSHPSLQAPAVWDWQDPGPTHLSQAATEHHQSDDHLATISSLPVLPSIRFIAKLSTPLILPLQIAMHLLSILKAPPSQESLQQQQQSTYETLLFTDILPPGAFPSDPFVKDNLTFAPNGEEKSVRHAFTLFSLQTVLAFKLTELPFSHPRQIVDLLPILRQWTLVGQILRRSYTASASAGMQVNSHRTDKVYQNGQQNGNSAGVDIGCQPDDSGSDGDDSDEEFETVDEELAAMLAPNRSARGQGNGTRSKPGTAVLPIDISLEIPVFPGSPSFHIIYPSTDGDTQPSHFSFEVLGNGIINVTDVAHAGPPREVNREGLDGKGKDGDKIKEVVNTVLAVTEDIGLTVEYLRS